MPTGQIGGLFEHTPLPTAMEVAWVRLYQVAGSSVSSKESRGGAMLGAGSSMGSQPVEAGEVSPGEAHAMAPDRVKLPVRTDGVCKDGTLIAPTTHRIEAYMIPGAVAAGHFNC